MLTRRIALVTGASRGIGAAIVRALASAGASVIATDIAKPVELAADVNGLSTQLDVTKERDWIDAMAFARREAGGLDILVNNAGVFFLKPLAETSLDEWRHLHAVNLDGMFLGCKHAIPLLSERAALWSGGTSIINMSSAAGLVGGANFVAYSSSKGAVRLLTKSLAIELAPQKVRVNSIHPGFVDTPMGEQVISAITDMAGIGRNDARSGLIAAHPLGRSAVSADIAEGVVFLASDKAGFITGTELAIDGGMTAQ
jgi:NAD(P)-dependent dehydrogenase (short-subunit alcohol dehydrogenase family)